MQRILDCATPSTTGRARLFDTIPRAAVATPPYANAATPTAAPFAASPTDFSISPASCYSDKLRSIPSASSRPQPNANSFCSTGADIPSAPTCLRKPHRAQALSRMPRSGTGASRRRAASWTGRARCDAAPRSDWLHSPIPAGLPPRPRFRLQAGRKSKAPPIPFVLPLKDRLGSILLKVAVAALAARLFSCRSERG